ncbi:uncharacterized protein FIBRA_00035 [Fibroporia radiculosa]|uniref:Phosphatidic acid phosphatase type 2/haloperoxidase domain-containing protein n=1 Tax=Fibroporia radiculosa TaxID=599839 RepID=J7SBQ9_9APHY|nr:uncharacterized protein FIBRA_00035 [Fibroporia radiculosa]CCL98041.1 predicted protein [Fibroporia radiculosa]
MPPQTSDPYTANAFPVAADAHRNHLNNVPNRSASPYDSRSSTPDPIEFTARRWDEATKANGTSLSVDEVRKEEDCEGISEVGAGLRPEEVYDRTMSGWRAAIRRRVRKNVIWESVILGKMQEFVRHPILDGYFVYTSSLGTHTFFMISLPALVFFGYTQVSTGLILVLAMGVYASSFLKDLVCSPRPFAPPVTRLTIGTHHLEYGFPSTHSTNSVSIALYFYSILREAYTRSAESEHAHGLSSTSYYILSGVLLFYVFSIVYGRLYTGMHSITDCVVGVLLGAGIWAVNLVCNDLLHAWIRDSGWIVPAVTIPLCLLLVHRHPQPVDDCPCFEDAIAFISVIMGEILSRWYMLHNGYDENYFVLVMPGKMWGNWFEMCTWWSVATIKMTFGILIIFMWRIFAKTIMHIVLPPIFRLLSQAFTLPHRRFYTPATDYKNVPAEKGLHPIPSVIDLTSMMEMETDVGNASASGFGVGLQYGGIYGERNVKLRGAKGRDRSANPIFHGRGEKSGILLSADESDRNREDVKHYDADVLTKVVVYSGIGMFACGVIPVLFEAVGLGLRIS